MESEPEMKTTYNGKEEFKFMGHRGISAKDYEKYGVKTRLIGGVPIELGYPYPKGSFKLRHLQKKGFHTKGPIAQEHIFGKNIFEPGGDVITITEGENDAIAVYSMTNTPAVSIKSAVTARKDCEEEWDYLNSFKKIVICFDSDTAGSAAEEKLNSLFDFNKVHYVQMQLKDAHQYLESSLSYDFVRAWKAAKKFSPDNVISTFDEIRNKLAQREENLLATYPFEGLQNALHGLHQGEVVVFKGDEGIGKTEVFRAMEHHILKEDDSNKIGILHLEEDEGTTIRGVANYEHKVPYLHLNDSSDIEEILRGYKEAVADDETRVYIYDSYDVGDHNKLVDNIRFMVSSYGCSVIFLDHITWLATGLLNEDERRVLDALSQKLKLLAKELNFCLVMISHTNDDGKTRGSRNITKVGNTVIHMSRDKTSAHDEERKKTYFEVEKGRGGGCKTGPAGFATYEEDNLLLVEPTFDKEFKI